MTSSQGHEGWVQAKAQGKKFFSLYCTVLYRSKVLSFFKEKGPASTKQSKFVLTHPKEWEDCGRKVQPAQVLSWCRRLCAKTYPWSSNCSQKAAHRTRPTMRGTLRLEQLALQAARRLLCACSTPGRPSSTETASARHRSGHQQNLHSVHACAHTAASDPMPKAWHVSAGVLKK